MIRLGDRIVEGCPFEQIAAEAFEVLAYFEDWESGHSPVTTGRAPWLPAAFVQGMHVARSEIARAKVEALDRNKRNAHKSPTVVSGRQVARG